MPTDRTMRPRQLTAVLAIALLAAVLIAPALAAPPLKVTSATPSEAEVETINLDVEISGSGFEQGAAAIFYRTGSSDPGGVVVNSTTYLSGKKLRANIDLPAGTSIDLYDIEVELLSTRRGKGVELFSVKEKTTGPPPEPTLVPLDSLGGSGSGAAGALDPIGANPIIVVGSADVDDVVLGDLAHAAVWEVDPTTLLASSPSDLGLLAGGETSSARAIASDGLIVGVSHNGLWRTTPNGNPQRVTQGVYWLSAVDPLTELVNLAVLNGGLDRALCDLSKVEPYAETSAASSSGFIVGRSDFGPCREDGWPATMAVIWQLDAFGVASNPTAMGELNGPRDSESAAHGVNESGYVVGARWPGNSTVRAYLVIPTDEDPDGAPDTWYKDDDTDGANDLMVDLGLPPNGSHAEAFAISSGGIVTGRAWVNKKRSSDGRRAWRIVPEDSDQDGEPDTWFRADRKGFNELMEVLPILPTEGCIYKAGKGLAANDDGLTVGSVGSAACGASAVKAVRWSPSGNIEDLNDLIQAGDGWQRFSSATWLTPAERIVGNGRRDDDTNRGFLITY